MGESVAKLSLLILKERLLLPYSSLSLRSNDEDVIHALEQALLDEEKKLLVSHEKLVHKNPRIGILAALSRFQKSNGFHQVVIQGQQRVIILPHNEATATYQSVKFDLTVTDGAEKLEQEIRGSIFEFMEEVDIPSSLKERANSFPEKLPILYQLANHFSLDDSEKLPLIEASTRETLYRSFEHLIRKEIDYVRIKKHLSKKAKRIISRRKRKQLLRQQLLQIRAELGEDVQIDKQLESYERALKRLSLPSSLNDNLLKDIQTLRFLQEHPEEQDTIQQYLSFVFGLPWTDSCQPSIDLKGMRRHLNESHYNLIETKEKILEYFSEFNTQTLDHLPVLCLMGPPGVGKTTLARSIATACSRGWSEFSLVGIHEEAQLKGCSRGRSGARAGKLIYSIKNAGSFCAVVLLDDIDKIAFSGKGDPASVLIEVLDRKENHHFIDHYLNFEIDLSQIIFITTATSYDGLSLSLSDKLEVIYMGSYTPQEKLQIAKKYLLPQLQKNFRLSLDTNLIEDSAVEFIIRYYTKEAGVRQLQKKLSTLLRRITLKRTLDSFPKLPLATPDIQEHLGPEIYSPSKLRSQLPAGVATGLAWTETGGEVMYIESTLIPRSGTFKLTGHLGKVMSESAEAALSYIHSHQNQFGIKSESIEKGVHIHVPSGSIPKDGPSAGVTITVALLSSYLDLPTNPLTAMTGEMTLSGLVLPVGGIKEKVIAAHRVGIKNIFLPAENERDLVKVVEDVRREIVFIFVNSIEEVITHPSVFLETVATFNNLSC